MLYATSGTPEIVQQNTTSSFRRDAMKRTFAAAVFALLTVTAPAHAAFVETLDADLSLNFPTFGLLTGNIRLTRQDDPHAAVFLGPFYGTLDLSLNGSPLFDTNAGINAGRPVPGAYLAGSPLAFCDFIVNTPFLPPNPTYSDSA
jgi:hypothetical protein